MKENGYGTLVSYHYIHRVSTDSLIYNTYVYTFSGHFLRTNSKVLVSPASAAAISNAGSGGSCMSATLLRLIKFPLASTGRRNNKKQKQKQRLNSVYKK